MKASASSCVLQTLDNPLLNGISLGLSAQEDGQLVVQTSMFPCCSAQGMAWDERHHGYHSCPMKQRLRRVKQLMEQHRQLWPKAQRGPHQVPPAWGGQLLQELALVLRRDRPPGTVCYSQQKQQPSLLWSKALAVLWRFGVEARVLNLQQAKVSDLAIFTQDSAQPLALFVEHADKLWDPLYAERLEFIVQRAYNAEAFLWIDFIADSMPQADPDDDASLMANVARRVAKRRQQHPLDHLSQDCISRLQSICGGPLRGETQHA